MNGRKESLPNHDLIDVLHCSESLYGLLLECWLPTGHAKLRWHTRSLDILHIENDLENLSVN